VAEITYVESTLINVAPERAFDFRLDFANLPDYNPNVSNLRRVADGANDGVGAEYVFDLQLAGAPDPIESPLRITSVDRPNRFTYDTGPGWMAKGDCTFEAKDGGTLVSLRYTLVFPGEVDDATSKAMSDSGRGESRIELENMKKILES
jgi:hypothetical protein